MAVLYGILFGSVIMLWPWQQPISSVIDRHGENRVVQSVPVLPQTYEGLVGEPMLWLCLLAFSLGAGLVSLLLSIGSVEH